jgi:toxin ParE1/3/4
VSQYRVSPLALQDLERISDYIGQRNPTAAVKLLERLFQSFKTLAKAPLLGEKRADLPGHPRVFCVGNYLIVYDPLPDGIKVGRVVDARQDLVTLLRQTS